MTCRHLRQQTSAASLMQNNFGIGMEWTKKSSFTRSFFFMQRLEKLGARQLLNSSSERVFRVQRLWCVFPTERDQRFPRQATCMGLVFLHLDYCNFVSHVTCKGSRRLGIFTPQLYPYQPDLHWSFARGSLRKRNAKRVINQIFSHLHCLVHTRTFPMQ